MKIPKRNHHPPPQRHMGSGKDRALANALLRMSEKTVKQEQNKTDDVIYCGDEEPFHGWTNAIPNPRYSGTKRPKNNSNKKKKKNSKKGSNGALMWGMTGMTSAAVDEQNAYATLRDMYDSYKKSKTSDNLSKKKKIVDPETYEYVPWNERTPDDVTHDGKAKMPLLRTLRGPPPRKLVEVLEKYVKRGNSRATDVTSVAASDVLEYYDKYKWNFAKENKLKPAKNKQDKERNTRHIHLPSMTSERENNLEPNVKEKLVRYVNGVVHKKRQNKSLHKEGRNAFYIRIHEPDPDSGPSMVKLERKRGDNGQSGEAADRWVARVIIKQPDESSMDWIRPYNDAESNSSVIIVPDTRWKQKLGVVEGERERIQKEMEKIRFQQQQQMKLNKLKNRLHRDNRDVIDETYRVKRGKGKIRTLPPMFSLAEAAKVSVKYNVEPLKRRGMGRGVAVEEPPDLYLSRVRVPLKAIESGPPAPESPHKGLGEPSVTQIFPSGELTSETKDKDEPPRSGRLFLKRGAAIKTDNHMTSQSNVRLPVLPKKAKLEQVKTGQKRREAELSNTESSLQVTDDNGKGNDVINPLPLAHGASATFQSVLSGASESNLNTGRSDQSSSSDDASKQQADIAQSMEKKPHKSTDFVRYKVIPQPGPKVAGTHDRRPLHPPHTKNRGQERIQDLIGQEQGAVNSVIHHITSKLGKQLRIQDSIGNTTDTYKSALNSAIARSKILEDNKQKQIPANLEDGNRRGNVVMRRRVVPPILSTPSVAHPESSPNDLPTVTTLHPQSEGDTTSQDDVTITSQTKEEKQTKRKRPRVVKRTKKMTSQKSTNKSSNTMLDDIILSGDVIIKQRPTPQLLEHSFAASITSVKPSRRVVNLSPPRIVQKA